MTLSLSFHSSLKSTTTTTTTRKYVYNRPCRAKSQSHGHEQNGADPLEYLSPCYFAATSHKIWVVFPTHFWSWPCEDVRCFVTSVLSFKVRVRVEAGSI